jgi:hypothetical protein
VCDRIEPTIPPASQDARAQVVVGQRTDGIRSAGWLSDVDHPATARVPDQGADHVGIIPTSVIRAGGNTHRGRPSNLEDELSLRNLKARKLQNVQQHYRRQDFLYYGLKVDSHSSIRTAVDAEDGFILLCQNLDLSLWDARDAVVYALSGAALECFQGKVKDWRRLDRHWTVHDVFHILGSIFDAKLTVDSNAHRQFTTSGAYTWSLHVSANPKLATDPEKLVGALVHKGMNLQSSLCSEYHGQRHLLDFVLRSIQGTAFYPHVRQDNIHSIGDLQERIVTALNQQALMSESRLGASYTRNNLAKVYLGDAHLNTLYLGACERGSSALDDGSFGSRLPGVSPGSYGFSVGSAGSCSGPQTSPGTSQAAVNFFTKWRCRHPPGQMRQCSSAFLVQQKMPPRCVQYTRGRKNCSSY